MEIQLPTPRNRLLAALPIESFAKLWPHLESVELLSGHELMRRGRSIPAVYFPETSYAAVLVRLADGAAAEVCVVGREGMVGLPLLSGSATGALEASVRGAGTMLRMDAESFGRALDHVPGLVRLLLRYALAFQEQAARTMACNGHYPLEQRLAYRLLMLHDHHGSVEFPMTMQLLASMLEVGLAELATPMWRLQQAAMVSHRHDRVTVLDRKGLEERACECHGATCRRFAELLGPDAQSV